MNDLEINIRQYAQYHIAEIKVGGATFDLGLLNERECLWMADTLKEAAERLESGYE